MRKPSKKPERIFKEIVRRAAFVSEDLVLDIIVYN